MNGPASPPLAILIVSFNTRDLTLACLRSVFAETRNDNIRVVVVDNGSDDGSAEAIEEEFPAVHLLRFAENLGFGRANNVAAAASRTDFLLLLNPDTLVVDHGVDRLVDFALAHPGAGIWGGRTVFADGSLNPKCCWRFMTLWSLVGRAVGLPGAFWWSNRLNPEAYGGWLRDSVREVDVVAGCFFLIRRDLWDKLGGFDERFFMYGEETDLCCRAHRMGARPLFTPHATIIHYGGASERVRASKIQKLFAGKATYITKHWCGPRRTLALRLLRLHALMRTMGYSLLAGFSRRHRQSARQWREVWRSRGTWSTGYDTAYGAQATLHRTD